MCYQHSRYVRGIVGKPMKALQTAFSPPAVQKMVTFRLALSRFDPASATRNWHLPSGVPFCGTNQRCDHLRVTLIDTLFTCFFPAEQQNLLGFLEKCCCLVGYEQSTPWFSFAAQAFGGLVKFGSVLHPTSSSFVVSNTY